MIATETESMGRYYMALAVQYGHIELQNGLILYSGKYLQGMGAINKETGEAVSFNEAEFYFEKKTGGTGIITECYYPAHIIERMEYEKETPGKGFYLPVTFETTAKIIPFPGLK